MNKQQRKEIIEKIKQEIDYTYREIDNSNLKSCKCFRQNVWFDNSKCWECLLEELE